MHIAYWEGRWKEATAIIDDTFSEVGPAHALSRFAFEMRGRIRLARDDTKGSLEDAELSLALARQAKDPQTLFPALSFAAVAALEQGRAHDAETSRTSYSPSSPQTTQSRTTFRLCSISPGPWPD